SLKLRMGVEPFHRDLERLAQVRASVGPDVRLAVDVNGSWSVAETIERAAAMAPYGLDYLEQPTAVGDWDAFAVAGRASAIPLMADESLTDAAALDALARLGAPFLGHLKIVKAGGPRPLVAAARRLMAAGVGVMVGQMNEGVIATAATVHCALALRPRHTELYGAYGLLADPAGSLAYRHGAACLPDAPGIWPDFNPAHPGLSLLWEFTP
ncbi:MAG: mandelate racemase, partial [Alphaproteobacteria bacterium]|nr:mandelate racemase [Alphaproteobacteria bacterium]